MPHSYSTLLVHAVFSTKDRLRLMDATIRPDLFAYMGGIVRELGGVARIINGTEDHVHMLMALAADMAVSECLRVVKTNSSRWVHGAPPISQHYITQLEEFRDEFNAFLREVEQWGQSVAGYMQEMKAATGLDYKLIPIMSFERVPTFNQTTTVLVNGS